MITTPTNQSSEAVSPVSIQQVTAWLHQHLDLRPEARARLGDIYTLAVEGEMVVVLNHPDHARYVLQQPQRYPKGFHRMLRMADDSGRRAELRLLRPHFHRQRLAALCDRMVATIDECMDQWAERGAFGLDLHQAFSEVTLAVLVRAMFGAELPAHDFAQLCEALLAMVEQGMDGESSQGLRNNATIQPQLNCFDRIFDCALDRHQHTVNAGREPTSLLAMLLDLAEEGSNQPLSSERLREEILFLFFVGFENIAHGLTWALRLLMQHPAALAKAVSVAESVLGAELPTLASLGQLDYLGMVLQEALRLHAPAPWLMRHAACADNIDGHPIPAGASMVIPAKLYHDDPELWPNPTAFEPERFAPENVAKQHPCAFLPFGKGQRFCLGKDFALMEGKLILAMVLQRFDFASATE